MKKLKVRGYHFRKRLDEFRLQLRYSLMALLSENKVSLFNPSIIHLMDSLIEKRWNNNDRTANFSAFIIDKMHYELDSVNEPYEDLVQVFMRLRKNREFDAEF